jgi:hypothetical protein
MYIIEIYAILSELLTQYAMLIYKNIYHGQLFKYST